MRLILCLLAFTPGILLTLRAWTGPLEFLRSPMNAESVFSVAVMAAILGFAGQATEAPGYSATGRYAAAALALVTAAFAWTLWFPFTSDDYVHVFYASRVTWEGLGSYFTVPGGDFHFRPLTMAGYWLEYQWAGHGEWPWRASNLAIHLANCALLYGLARHLDLSSRAAALAAALFGIHGSRPEVVAWVAARFDLLATLFVLGGLLLWMRSEQSRAAYAGSLACCLMGLLSKESAFVFPVLATLLGGVRRWRFAIPFYLLAGVVFTYRWWLLGGIGGYRAPGSGAAVLEFSMLRSMKGLLLRLPATLFFPVNWSRELEWWLVAAMLLFVAAMVAWIWLRPSPGFRPQGWMLAAFTLTAALPAQHLLLIGPDLEKSRVLYLPSAGFALLLASAAGSRWWVLAAVVVFQLAALQHNLLIWGAVSRMGRAVCASVADRMREGVVEVRQPPNVVDGVYVLQRGLAECAALMYGADAAGLRVLEPGSPGYEGALEVDVRDASLRPPPRQ
ncbi:MAG: hypothetical protein K2X35_23190 [Bryobacteraceae bacterium]|nr:hypothetical protein [Bryobacteraceae bacterium]